MLVAVFPPDCMYYWTARTVPEIDARFRNGIEPVDLTPLHLGPPAAIGKARFTTSMKQGRQLSHESVLHASASSCSVSNTSTDSNESQQVPTMVLLTAVR